MDHFLQMKNVSKTFGEVAALHHVNFEVGTNEIVGLLGDNGAGKSTLVKIITGYHQPDPGGEFYPEGEEDRTPLGGARPRHGHRGRLPGARARGQAVAVAQHLHGARAFQCLGASRPARDAGGDDQAHAYADGLHLLRGEPGIGGQELLRRRAPGSGHHPGAVLQGGDDHPGRADHGPVPFRD